MLHILLFFFRAGTATLPEPDFDEDVDSAATSWPRTVTSMAVSKISCTPVISLEEHSMYLAPIFWATDLPCCCVTGVRPCVLRSSMQVRLFRRSDLRPQSMMGVVGQKWRTSGYHWEVLVHLEIIKKFVCAYLIQNVLEGVGAVDRKADEKQIGLRV